MPSVVKAAVQLRAVSGVAEDEAVNTFYFLNDTVNDPPIGSQITDLANRLTGFYNTIHSPSTEAMAKYIGDQITRATSGCAIYFYNATGIAPPAEWGTPIDVRSWTLGPSLGTSTFPSEVSVVAAFHGDLTDIPETQTNPSPPPAVIRPASRRRGRIFLGPLMAATGSEDSGTHEMRVGSTFRLIVSRAMQALQAANTGDLDWVVSSRTADEVFQVVGGYVDNAFDTQRRRGQKATARDSWSA